MSKTDDLNNAIARLETTARASIIAGVFERRQAAALDDLLLICREVSRQCAHLVSIEGRINLTEGRLAAVRIKEISLELGRTAEAIGAAVPRSKLSRERSTDSTTGGPTNAG